MKLRLFLLTVAILTISCQPSAKKVQSKTHLVQQTEIVTHDKLFIRDHTGDCIFYEIGTIFVPENREK